MTQPLYFAHANGFPVGSYQAFLKPLSAVYALHYIPKLGHSAAYPIDNNWHSTAAEICAYIESHAIAPVVGVGHSFGSLALLQAAIQKPQLFAQIVVIEPPLVMSYGALAMYLAKLFKRADQLTPAGRTMRRRSSWQDGATLFADWRKKSLFQDFSDENLRIHIDAATVELPDGTRQLDYRVDVEAEVFRTMPTDLECLRRKLPMPATLVCAEKSDLHNPYFAKRLCKLYGMTLRQGAGGHLLPLELPEQTAALVLEILEGKS